MPGEQPPLPGPGPVFDKLENFTFLMSRHDPAAKTRQYSFDADTGLVPFGNVSMDYDQTEGMGGLSVSSYESIEDDRSSLDLRGYPYHGTCQAFEISCVQCCICYAIAPLRLSFSSGALSSF